MFNPFPKNLPSFMPMGSKKDEPVPEPPNRKSSCTKATVKTLTTKCKSNILPNNNNRENRHAKCFKKSEDVTGNNNKFGTITLRSQKTNQNERIYRSKSTGAVTKALSTLLSNCGSNKTSSNNTTSIVKRPSEPVRIARIERHARINDATSPTRRRMLTLRQSSLSPVAFGRSISRERTFAEEKKRLESTLPLSRTSFEASTNILRDPSLKSPQDVKKAVRCYATCPVRMRSKSLPRIKEITYTPNLSINTTTRHTMCYPHVHESKMLKTLKPLTKTTTFANCRKVPSSYGTTKIKSKTDSTITLARTNSTFSVESKEKTSKGSSKIKNGNKTSKPSQIKSIHNSRSDSNIFSKRCQQTALNKLVKKSSSKELSMPLKIISKTSYFPDSVTCIQETRSLKHDIPYKHHKYESYESTRSVSPLKHDENTNHCYADKEDIFSEFGEHTDGIDNLLWQYEINNKKDGHFNIHEPVMDIARPESPSPSTGKIRKFSPTREIRVPPEEARPITPFIDWSPRRPVSPVERTFSPTREIRVPHTPRSCSPIEHAPLLPAQSATPLDETFLPTREVRIPPTNRNVRSPSRRKIDSCRSHLKNGETSKIIRASSLSSADDERVERGLYRCSELAHSATSLSCLDRHSPTCKYHQHSERFTDLNRFYNTLERVGQLERATSTTDFKPIRKESELLDFDEWRQVRLYERAEKELNYLVHKLKQDQREKDFIFQTKDVEDIKWRRETDFSLHSRKKSVEDLREDFEKKQLFKDFQYFASIQPEKEYIRPYYRRNTVADLTSSLENKMILETQQSNTLPHNQLVSTLSKDEKYKISKQLNEIYANNSENKQAVNEEFVVTVNANSKRNKSLKVRCNSTLTTDDLLGPVSSKKNASLGTMVVHKQNENQRSTSPVHLARETRGATAAKNADVRYTKPPEVPPLPPPQPNTGNEQLSIKSQENVDLEQKNAKKEICEKIHYFESRKFDEPPKTVYHARDDSSPDENEVLQMIEQNMKTRAKEKAKPQELSASLTDLKEIFGERNTARVSFYRSANAQNSNNTEHIESVSRTYQESEFSPPMSLDLCDTLYRSRSLSPNSETSSYLSRIHTGEVQKIKEKFESLNEQQLKKDFFGVAKLRKARSDSELSMSDSGSKDALELSNMNIEAYHNEGVSWITQKMNEVEHICNNDNARGRSRKRRVISPIPLKNRLMPHIDNISKRAALKEEVNCLRKISQCEENITTNDTGLVDRMRTHYERTGSRYLSLSNPDVSNGNQVTKHLTADWIAHKFPNPKQNTFVANNKQIKDIDIFKPPIKIKRSCSTSPNRPPKSICHQASTTLTSSLKPYFGDDIFANQNFDPSKHKPKARYVPDGAETNDWKRSMPSSLTIVGGSSSITFQGSLQ